MHSIQFHFVRNSANENSSIYSLSNLLDRMQNPSMSSGAGDSSMKKSSLALEVNHCSIRFHQRWQCFFSQEIKYRTEDLKQSLVVWRHILLPLNNLLEWEHKYDPCIIFGIITFIFMWDRDWFTLPDIDHGSWFSFSFIFQTNPPVLTLISGVVLILVLLDLLVPVAVRILFKNDKWFVYSSRRFHLKELVDWFPSFLRF